MTSIPREIGKKAMNPRAMHFDNIAEKWDSWDNLAVLQSKLAAGLEVFGLKTGETVLDIGCGTGNLTLAILAKLSSEGRVFAVDCSTRMLDVAKRKISDPRVSWLSCDAAKLPLDSESCDRIICFSVWPHFDNPVEVAKEFLRVLRQRSTIHIWHLASRQKINQIHANGGEAISKDILAPVEDTANQLASAGFCVTAADESTECYLVTAVKPE